MIFGVKVFNRSIKINSKRKTLGEKLKQHQIKSSIIGKLVNRYTNILQNQYCSIPKKVKKRSKLHKIVSCKLSENQSDHLSFYARHYYIRKSLTQPSVSMLVRRIISNFLIQPEEGRTTILANGSDF